MSISEFLDTSPFFDIVRYGKHEALDAVAFIGSLRKHPYDPEKCLLLTAEQEKLHWLEEGVVLEFRIGDVLAADELASPVSEQGAVRPLVRLWIKRGAIALRYDPFEVGDKFLGPRDSLALRKKLAQVFHTRSENH
ncbi:MAG TPA: hypothetical protein VN445_04055 [Rectinemataceae bacterium]|nr:hypothetical protein [Rectinemataceae bacterium]